MQISQILERSITFLYILVQCLWLKLSIYICTRIYNFSKDTLFRWKKYKLKYHLAWDNVHNQLSSVRLYRYHFYTCVSLEINPNKQANVTVPSIAKFFSMCLNSMALNKCFPYCSLSQYQAIHYLFIVTLSYWYDRLICHFCITTWWINAHIETTCIWIVAHMQFIQ